MKFKDYLIQKGYSKRTIAEDLRSIKGFELFIDKNNIKQSEISYNDVVEYLSVLNNLSIGTRKNRLQTVKKYCDFLVKIEILTQNPVIHLNIKREAKKVVLSSLGEDDLDTIYRDFAEIFHVNIKYKILLGLIIYQGLSSNEIKRLLITDFNFDKGIIELPDLNRSNGRIMPLNVKQLLPLINYCNNKNGEMLFECNVSNMHYLLNKHLKQVTEYNYNVLRESRIILWLRQYGVRKAQYLGGFKYISSLEKYRVSEVEGLRKKLEACFGA